jgi:hypothetical protein
MIRPMKLWIYLGFLLAQWLRSINEPSLSEAKIQCCGAHVGTTKRIYGNKKPSKW